VRSRLLTTTKELDQVFRQWYGKADNIRIVTAWATMDCAARDGLEKARSKISTMVVGLDFYTTSPSFLESFLSVIRIGTSLQGGTFHPKVYLFEAGEGFCYVMGSSNFTRGGFGDNTELNICVEGRKTDLLFRQVTEFINQQEEQSEAITKTEIRDYRAQFEKLKETRRLLTKYRPTAESQATTRTVKGKEAAGDALPDQLNRTWPEFRDLLLAPKRKQRVVGRTADGPGYLQTAERCRDLFAQHGRLASIPPADRKFIGGITKEGGWFGSMKGSGRFGTRLNNSPAILDAALDHIPRTGGVRKRDFDDFKANYKWEGSGVGNASRLLAMKRPDLFVCIDSKNRRGIAEAFDVTASSLQTFEGYWDLMQRVWRCPWRRSPRPGTALERRIWNARVALLDSLYYDADA
jgi:HKD family nuclease